MNNLAGIKTKQVVDDRKSWSYSNLNTHTKSNSKELDISKNPFFVGVDFKNTRNTTGNPEHTGKSIGGELKGNESNEKI